MNNFARIWSYFRSYKLLLFLALISSAGVSATDAAVAYIVKDIMDGIFISKDTEMLTVIPIAIAVLFSVRFVARFTQVYSIQYAGQKAVQQIRDDMFNKLIVLPMGYFSENSIGIVMTKVISDVNNLQNAISSALRVFRSALTIIFLIAVVFHQNSHLALSIFVLAPLLFIIVHKSGKKIKTNSRKIQEQTGHIGNALNESFTGIRVVKSFNNEEREFDNFKKVSLKELKYKLRQALISSISSPLIETLAGVAAAGIIAYGGMMVIQGQTTTGTFFSFLTAFGMMFEPIKKLNNYNHIIQIARASAERIFSVLDTQNDIIDNNGTIQCIAKGKTVTFENISFSYNPEGQQILNNININVPYGKTIALVGSSGAGKSTLVSLIPRFYDVTNGSVKIGDTDIRDFDVYSLRRNIGIVSQSPFLFNNTIRYNMTYGCSEDVSEERLKEAAEQAYALDFINELPDGFDTMLGERGSKLSGGQKQRLTIARALLTDPQILILDEATSALDTESEKVVQKAMNNLMKDRTCFTIAHRLSTIIDADLIAVMDKGQVVAIGPHAELLKTSPLYTKLYEMQFNV